MSLFVADGQDAPAARRRDCGGRPNPSGSPRALKNCLYLRGNLMQLHCLYEPLMHCCHWRTGLKEWPPRVRGHRAAEHDHRTKGTHQMTKWYREYMTAHVEQHADEWARRYVRPAFAGDIEAAGHLAIALTNAKRGPVAHCMWQAKVPREAFRPCFARDLRYCRDA